LLDFRDPQYATFKKIGTDAILTVRDWQMVWPVQR
jgi:hypothetical protein